MPTLKISSFLWERNKRDRDRSIINHGRQVVKRPCFEYELSLRFFYTYSASKSYVLPIDGVCNHGGFQTMAKKIPSI